MHNKIKQLLNSIRKDSSKDDLASVHATLKEIKKLLIVLLIKEELEGVHGLFAENQKDDKEADELKEPNPVDIKTEGDKEVDPIENRDKALKELGEIATTKTENDVEFYLLHRPTENFEYGENAEINEYETEDTTEWYAEYMSGEINQEGQNPVVSCWVPEDKILGSRKPHGNTGAWGDLGKNPFADTFKVEVKPGKYKIYQELRQRR